MQVSPVLAGTLGFGVKRAEIPGLQRHLLDLDPFADPLTEEFWETVCFHTVYHQPEALFFAKLRIVSMGNLYCTKSWLLKK